jgi:hypothetical protein
MSQERREPLGSKSLNRFGIDGAQKILHDPYRCLEWARAFVPGRKHSLFHNWESARLLLIAQRGRG